MIEYVKDEVFINVGMAEGSSYPSYYCEELQGKQT